nr:hypothetical protein [uncultured Sphaerochaeta sp.]
MNYHITKDAHEILDTISVDVLSALPPWAKEPTPNDVTVAIAAITDTTICAVAAFLNTPKLDLPGSNLYFRDGETLPHILTFQEADLGKYLPVFMATKEGGTSFFASLMQAARAP